MRGLRFIAMHFVTMTVAMLILPTTAATWAQQKTKLPRPQRLDRGVEFRRDPATGELRDVRRVSSVAGPGAGLGPLATIHARVSLVEINCNVLALDNTPLRGLVRDDFRVLEDGIEQSIAHFDASSEAASIVLILDASPSVFRDLEQMKAAARALAAELSPRDAVAVVAVATGAHLLLPFSRDRALLEKAMASPELARVADTTQSNIYQGVYLTARELFGGRRGRKAIVLLTDGQDSGLGLSWDPASAAPQPGEKADRLTFEDVSRVLAAAGIEVYTISTQNRPHAMTDEWLEAHRGEMLVTPAARELGMAHYTLYLAELVRRAGGQLYFLHEIGNLMEVYRRIAQTLSNQYTLGYYPAAGARKPGWHGLRVELRGRRDTRLAYRVTYYVPAGP